MNLAEILAGRAGLVGIQEMLSGRMERRKLRGVLNGLLSGASLGPCRLRRAKFKPERYLNAYYDVTLHCQDGRPGIKWEFPRAIAVTWSSPEEKERPESPPDPSGLQAEAFSRGLVAPFQQLAGEAPASGMRVLVFPLDVRFPQLVRLADPRVVTEMLSEGLANMAIRWQATPSRVSVTPVRYRPGQRHVLRYDAAGEADTGGRVTFFAKIYNNQGKGVRAFETANRVCDWLDAHANGVAGARPLDYHAEEGAILYPKISGIPLSRMLKKPGRRIGNSLRLAGSALRSLHEIPVSLVSSLERKTFADEVRTVTHASDHLRALLPEARNKIEMILDRAQELHEHLPQEAETFTHSDLKADHMLVTPNGLALIDFDTCSLMDPAFDVGKFLADLDWWHTVFGKPVEKYTHEQFLAGYSRDVPPARLARARLYEALVLLRIATRRAPLFSRDWAVLTMKLIHQSEGILNSNFAERTFFSNSLSG